tara:strand:- start:99 stop:278 length:180 start_codon:yes stop_codon:yes gene_type:complete
MNRTEAQNLYPGDQVKWNDPDGDECSRVLTIKTIKHYNEFMVIVDSDGNELHCYADELE